MTAKLEAMAEFGWAIALGIIGAIILWTGYYQLQAKHTSVLAGYEGKVSYEINKRDSDPVEWVLLKNGIEVATMDETNDAPPSFNFRVKTSTISAIQPGIRIEIHGVGPGTATLLCTDCVHKNLPFTWSRKA